MKIWKVIICLILIPWGDVVAENTIIFPEIAGGPAGWGGYVNRGERLSVRPHEASSANNVYEEGGVLKKRQGYTKSENFLILGGSYASASTGYEEISDNGISPDTTKISQEIEINSTTTGGDENFNGTTTSELVVALKMKKTGGTAGTFNARLYTVDGSGFPDSLLATSHPVSWGYLPTDSTEYWVYFYFESVILGTSNVCITIEDTGGIGGAGQKWMYSDGDGGYIPGGSARVAANYTGGAWAENSGVDFLFKFYYKKTSDVYFKSIHNYNGFDDGCFVGTANLTNNSHSVLFTSIDGVIGNEYTMFVENERAAYKIQTIVDETIKGRETTGANILPSYQGVTGSSKKVFCYPAKMIVGLEGYIAECHYNDYIMRIYKDTDIYDKLNAVQFDDSVALIPRDDTPKVWGTASYPLSGEPGDFTFTGLTNPITQAKTVMWHKKFMVWGNVIINSVEHRDRFYYSGQTTPEAGYADNNYDSVDGEITALVSNGAYAVVSTRSRTYCIFGNDFSTTYEKIEHVTLGGAINAESLCIYYDELLGNKIYGFSAQGIFEIDKTKKRFIHEKILKEIADIIPSDMFVCPDYRREMVLFSYRSAGVRKILGYNVRTKTWWPEDLTAQGMLSVVSYNSLLPRIYGFKDDELWDMYTGKNDDGAAISANYKTGPAYLNAGAQFAGGVVWLIHGNEDETANLTVNIQNDYGTADAQVLALRDTDFPDDVPVRSKVQRAGTASSIEIELAQDAVDQSFKVAKINVEAGGGRNVEQNR